MNKHLTNALLVFCVVITFALGCTIPSSSSSKIVRSGCVTPDGSRIALLGIEDMARMYGQPTIDPMRLILDGTSGKVVWKDMESATPLVCAPDNSVVSVSETGAKWLDSGKEILFSVAGKGRNTYFVGMIDASTIVREDRSYFLEQISAGQGRTRSSSTKSFNTFPTLLIDRLGDSGTRSVNFTESELDVQTKTLFFQYYFDKDRIVLQAGDRSYAYDVASGATRPINETYKDLQSNWVKADKYDAVETQRLTKDGVIEIYEGKGENAKLVRQIKKSDLNAKVISIIDCCNNGLIVLYWERETYVKVAKIDHLSGEVIWKSDALNSEYLK